MIEKRKPYNDAERRADARAVVCADLFAEKNGSDAETCAETVAEL